MRILIVGAGALGGYVGARLLSARKDVAFLVRPPRVEQLARNGLQLDSPLGGYTDQAVRCMTANSIDSTYDLVVVACKIYDLTAATTSISPAVGPDTAILPLLNGLAHLDEIIRVHGPHRVLGGLCTLAATRTADGVVRHLNDMHALALGERDGSLSPRVEALGALFDDAGFPHAASRRILLEMWEKFAFIVSALCMTVLTRVAQDRPAAERSRLAGALLGECRSVAASAGFALRAMALARARMILGAPDATLFDLLLDDLHRRPACEADTLLEDLARRARHGAVATPLVDEAQAALRRHRDAHTPRTARL